MNVVQERLRFDVKAKEKSKEIEAPEVRNSTTNGKKIVNKMFAFVQGYQDNDLG